MSHARPQPATELEAFCATRPAAQEVTELLAKLGFRLEFQMEEQRSHTSQLPPLPAQYHYKDAAVMYNQKSTPFDPFGETASRAGSAV